MKRPLKRHSAKPTKASTSWIDLTHRKHAERILVDSAWKITLADLTPGLAHDFNNVLTGILAVSEVCLAQTDAGHPFHESFSLIKQKVQDASQLVHRIARLHQEAPGCFDYQDVNSIIAEVAEILRKVVPKRIEIITALSAFPLPVYVDAVEFRRLLLSLALSAVNAMSGSGKLHFKSSRHKTLPALRQVHSAPPRPPAVCLTVTGPNSAFRAKPLGLLSEPSTLHSESHDGPSLSLHQARLFLEKHRGAMSVESAPASGTTLRLWLPESDFTEAKRANA